MWSTPALATVATLAVLVVGATGHTSVWVPIERGVVDSLTIVLAILASFAAGLVAVWVWARNGRARPVGRSVPQALTIGVLLSLSAISQLELRPPPPIQGTGTEQDGGREGIRMRSNWRGPAVRRPGDPPTPERPGPADPGRTVLLWSVAFLVVAGAAAGGILLRSQRRRVLRPAIEPEIVPDTRRQMHQVVVVAIDSMLDDPDPRTAIIGAYARMLEQLETMDASRFDYEGPDEHLQRVLSELQVDEAPLRELVDLFTAARFSTHRLTGWHRDRALAALRTIGAGLADGAPVAGSSTPAGTGNPPGRPG